MTSNKFQRTTIYNEFYRRVGVSNQLVKPMWISGDLMITCSLNVENRDFTDRDRAMLNLITPHLAHAIRNSFAYQRFSSALEASQSGVIAVNAKGKPLFVSEYARCLLEKYFAGEKRETNSLPESLIGWIKEIESASKTTDFKLPLAPLKVENQKGMLIIRFMYNSVTREKTLMLEERKILDWREKFEKFNLTKREAEIMFWIAQGKTDDVIAALLNISLRTVHKHVENIYTKLGVETRTGAMLKAVESL